MARSTKSLSSAQVTRLRKALDREKAKSAPLAKSLAEAVQRQAAAAEILRIISRSPADPQPVFDAIARSARRLFEAHSASIAKLVGDTLHLAALTATTKSGDEALKKLFPEKLTGEGALGKAILSGKPAWVVDFETDLAYSASFRRGARARGYRSLLAVPMIRDGAAIGGIAVTRRAPGRFTDAQIRLLQTFADQAVIAIENARRFNDEKEALKRQTATAEILKVIAKSPSDVQPVFEAIVASARRLLGGFSSMVTRLEGDQLHIAALTSTGKAGDTAAKRRYPARFTSLYGPANAIRTKAPFYISDAQTDPKVSADLRKFARARGYRSVIFVPMLRDRAPIGVISVTRRAAGSFTNHQIELLKTFADQAVIAIENVRLFRELEARNAELTQGLAREQAMGEILRLIGRSPTDPQPVFHGILSSAVRLAGADFASVFEVRAGHLHHVAVVAGSPGWAKAIAATFPASLEGDAAWAARTLARGQVRFIEDAQDVPLEVTRRLARAQGFRSVLIVPMLRQGRGVGLMNLGWASVRSYPAHIVPLLEAFAEQAVIAIENARLFNETKEALERQTATAEVLKTISRSTFDLSAVLQVLIENATRLAGANQGFIFRFDGEVARMAFSYNAPAAYTDLIAANPIRPGRGALVARTLLERRPVQIPDVLADKEFTWHEAQRLGGFRSMLGIPMLREGSLIGVIAMWTSEVRPFTEKQIELVSTFADQAVIAIENVRLFNETKEALERQTATAEILKVIASSPTDVQPVLDAVAENAAKLCGATDALILSVEGSTLLRRAHFGPITSISPARPLTRDTPSGRAILERRTIHVDDILVELERGDYPEARALQQGTGFRTILAVPLMREDNVVGAISIRRLEVRAFTPKQIELIKTFADQAVIAIENVRLFNETKEALERQTATAEILSVIAASPTDTKPVFDAIASCGGRLLGGVNALILLRRESQVVVVGSSTPLNEDVPEQVRVLPLDREKNFPSQVILDGKVLHIPDWESGDILEFERNVAKAYGVKSCLQVPLLRKGEGIGAIVVSRATAGPFHEKDIALLKSFADQAVIAIENVRLFNETREALERQTATAEVLKAISRSTFDLDAVLQTLVTNATQLCNAVRGVMLRPNAQGEYVPAASHGFPPEAPLLAYFRDHPLRPGRDSVTGRVLLAKKPAHIHDTHADAEYEHTQATDLGDMRTLLGVPMMRDGEPIGVVVLNRGPQPAPFSEREIELVTTFADQAVIAIENVRLFNETKEALERQTATGEILRALSRSLTDPQPVFDAIAEHTHRLCGAAFTIVYRYEGGMLNIVADKQVEAEASRRLRTAYPRPASSGHIVGRAVLEGRIQDSADVPADPRFPDNRPDRSAFTNIVRYRAAVVVPLLRDGAVIGAIGTARLEAKPFTETEKRLIQTFADQAVIAIENVRLFNETKESLERQTATAEILKVIASSPSDVQPVFDAIAASARRLLGGHAANVARRAGDVLELAAFTSTGEAGDSETSRLWPSKITGKGHMGKALLSAAAAWVEDIETDRNYSEEFRAGARARGMRSAVSVPMLREGEAIGVISVNRSIPGRFSDHQTNLLKTFADQAVIAIENVRLFNETKEALERQTATAEILKVISSSPTDVQPVFAAIAEKAAGLCAAEFGFVAKYDGGLIHHGASVGPSAEALQLHRAGYPMKPGSGSVTSRVVLEAAPVQIEDMLADSAYAQKGAAELGGFRSGMGVPMTRDGKVVGAIVVVRTLPGKFSDRQVGLLQTFADQAVIAIENVRLFKELETRTNALGESVQKLTALGEVGQAISSTLDLEVVLKTIATHAVQLTGLDGASIYEYDEAAEEFRVQVAHNFDPEFLQAIRNAPIRKGDGTVGGVAITREPAQVPDILEGSYHSSRKELLTRAGYRAVLTVPLLREDHIIGALSVTRKTPGPFADEIVELLKTFATQSAMAIQNARLYREIAEKGKQLEEASKHKSQFLASMSHELRTPLNAILGFNEMLLGEVYGSLPEDTRPPLAQMQTSGKHLLRLINNVLDLAKIEAGRMELAFSDYSVHDTVESVRATLRPLAEAKGLDFVVEMPADLPLAHGDPGRITQCLMNLAGNSLKFTKEGKVGICVTEKDGLLVYRVVDTGMGIPADKIGNLFTEFKQTDAMIASEYGGTGLGLSISKKFIEMHGGRIWAESAPGQGSTFIFEIPLRAGEEKTS